MRFGFQSHKKQPMKGTKKALLQMTEFVRSEYESDVIVIYKANRQCHSNSK